MTKKNRKYVTSVFGHKIYVPKPEYPAPALRESTAPAAMAAEATSEADAADAGKKKVSKKKVKKS